ncbi:neuraminidase-like domain-containing protein [Fodinibius sp.]|uniref:Tc toxin subunit A-related protein n=1 Tax=Fodinibius sp. TaxID=1872440 RepID=UPI003566B7A9
MRFLGPDSRRRAEQLAKKGGVVIRGLNERAAKHTASILEAAGAKATVEETAGETEPAFTVKVLDRQTSEPVSKAKVEVTGDGKSVIEGVTNQQGTVAFLDFEGLVNEMFTDERPEIEVSVRREDSEVKSIHKPFRWESFEATDGDYQLVVTAASPRPDKPETEGEYVVQGIIALENGEPAVGYTVRVFDRDLRSEIRLGESRTDKQGRYAIRYSPAAYGSAEKGSADLDVRVYTKSGNRRVGTEVDNRELTKIGDSSILFNANKEETINLSITKREGTTSLYEEVVSAIEPLPDEVTLNDLIDKDIYFLHHETGRGLNEIAFVVSDAQLQSKTGMPEGVFFGLAINEIGVYTSNENGIPRINLPAVLEISVDQLIEVVDKALEEHQIPSHIAENRSSIRNNLERLKASNAIESPIKQREKARKLGEIAGLDEDASASIADRFEGSTPTEETWAALVEEGAVKENQLPDLKLTFDLAEVTGGEPKLVETLKTTSLPGMDNTINTARDLGALDEEDWKNILKSNEIEAPAGQDVDSYANGLARSVEHHFPTSVFSHRVVQKDLNNIANQFDNVQALLDSDTEFFTNIVNHRKTVEEIDADEETKKNLNELAGLARTFTHLGVPEVLDDADLSSSEKIEEVEKRIEPVKTFISQNEGMDIRSADFIGLSKNGDSESGEEQDELNFEGIEDSMKPRVRRQMMTFQRVYSVAPNVDTANTLLSSGYSSAYDISSANLKNFSEEIDLSVQEAARIHNQAVLDVDHTNYVVGSILPLLPELNLRTEADNINEDLVNELRDLDGFEDLFRSQQGCDCAHCQSIFGPLAYYVDLLSFIEDKILSTTFNEEPDHPIHLNTRRPDLWDQLELSCKNATEYVPYLEIVNEVLSNYIVNVEELEPQEDETREEAVFSLFSSGDRSFDQPVNLPLEELRMGMERLGIKYPEAVKVAGGNKDELKRAWLGLSEEEISTVTTSIADDENVIRKRYGLTDDADLTKLTTDQLMKAADLTREELGRLAKLNYIDAGGSGLRIVTIHDEDAVQPTGEEVRGLDSDRLDHIFRFVRLRRSLPWTLEALDHVLDMFKRLNVSDGIDEDALQGISRLLRLQDKLDISVEEVCVLADRIPVQSLAVEENGLYDQLFNAQVYVEKEGRFNPSNPVHFQCPFFESPSATDEGSDPALPRLLSALELSEEAFVSLMKALRPHLNPFREIPGNGNEERYHIKLNIENLSLLYRHALIMHNRDLSVDELFQALDMIQTRNHPYVKNMDDLDDLLEFLQWIREAGLTLNDVEFSTGGGHEDEYLFDSTTADEFAKSLEERVTFTKSAFSEISELEDNHLDKLMTFLVSEGLVSKAGSSNERYRLTPSYNQGSLPQLPEEPLEQQKDTLSTILDRYIPEVHAADLLAGKLETTKSRLRSLAAIVAGSFAGNGRVLDRQLGIKLSKSSTASSDLLDFFEPLEEVQRIFERLEISRPSLEFAAKNPGLFGLQAGQDQPAGIQALRLLAIYSKLYDRFEDRYERLHTILTDEAFGDPFDSLNQSEKDRIVKLFSDLTTATEELARTLLGEVPYPGQAVPALSVLIDAWDLAKRMGTSGNGLQQLHSESYDDIRKARDMVYTALRDQYDDPDNRQAVLQPLREKMLGRKRDVLVSHLLARPELDFDDSKDLYYYFLLDPEMEGCAKTSRVVAGTSSLQLYVHRCRMNLEQTENGDIRVKPDQIPEAEWDWRRKYRIWEANRKVFLYPENYLEPELRDNKTPAFERLEDKLMEEDLDAEGAERLYRDYLNGFSEVADLRIVGSYFEQNPQKENEGTLYLIGKTAAQPAQFYLRTRQGDSWSAWEKIDQEINADKISPIIYLNQLYLFWVEIKTKPWNRTESSENEESFRGYRHDITLKYIVQKADDSWSAPQEVSLPSGIDVIEDPLVEVHDPYYDDHDIKMLQPKYQKTEYPSHGEYEYDYGLKFKPEPVEGYTLKDRMFTRIFPLVYGDRLYFQYGDEETVYRLNVRARDAYAASGEVTAENFNYFGGFTAGKIRLAKKEEWIQREKKWEQYKDTVALHLVRGATFDQHRYYYESEKDRTEPFGIQLDPGKPMLGRVPFHSHLESVNNAPHLWIYQQDDGAMLLERSGEMEIIGYKLRTRIARDLQKKLFREGIWSMLSLDTQYDLHEDRLFENQMTILKTFQTQVAESYDSYIWEIFFHTPLLIANTLNARDKYEEAERWFNVIFDPMGEELPVREKQKFYYPKDRNWRFLELHKLDLPKLKKILNGSSSGYSAYRKDPFNPHAIARLRPTAYQRNVVMKYIDNLLDWGDQLFTRDTRESINEATLLYITAADILGERPDALGSCETPAPETTYDSLETDEGFIVTVENMVNAYSNTRPMSMTLNGRNNGSDNGSLSEAFSSFNTMSTVNNSSGIGSVSRGSDFTIRGVSPIMEITDANNLPFDQPLAEIGDISAAELGAGVGKLIPYTSDRPVFCIPKNKKLRSYWDRVEDRLFKIRNCMNIEGVRRTLALFEPPVSPMMLAKARAAGLSIEEVMGSAMGELPSYRFSYLIGKAKEYVSTLRGLGGALLAALEKKDAEELAQLRSVHKQNIQRMTKQIRSQQIEVAKMSVDSLKKQKERSKERKKHLQEKIDKGLNEFEITSLALSGSALVSHSVATVLAALAPPAKAAPDIEVGYASLGGYATVKYGGQQAGGAAESAAQILRDVSTGLNMGAGIASTLGSYDRRMEEWKFQRDMADMEVDRIEKDIAAAEIRADIAEKELEIHEKQMEQTEEVYEFYESKFSNLGLYNWLSSEVKKLYRNAYHMALEVAQMAEKAYQYEMDDETTNFIAVDNWDGEHQGLLSGEKLMIQLQEMDKAYLENNQRDYEVNQSFSLAQIDPLALQKLRENGNCEFKIAEPFFDVAYPGQYKRRIKSVRLTIPCVTGPYVNVNAKLTLLQAYIREEPRQGEDQLKREPRSRNTSIATSQAQNDGGVFELSFNQERYMPFEGAGAVSDWKLQLPDTFRSFDYDSISDVLVHISYTAKEDGAFRDKVVDNLREEFNKLASDSGVSRGFSLKQEYASEFRQMYRTHDGDKQKITVQLDNRHFPYFLHQEKLELKQIVAGFKLDKKWSEYYSDGSGGAGPISAELKLGADNQSPAGSEILKKNNGIMGFQDKIPHASFDTSGANVSISEESLSSTIEFSKQELIALYNDLHSEAGVSVDQSNVSVADVDKIMDDIFVVLTVKIKE